MCSKLLISTAILALAGCVTDGGPAPVTQAQVAAPAVETREIGTLSPRKLAAGECGMFLWSKAADRSLVFFNTRGGAGQMMLDGREVKLVRAAADGAEVLGQFESQTFRHDQLSIELQIQFERRPGLARGAIIPQGALRLKRDDGWEYILPVGGLVGCEEA
jgi:hypothetical protein